MNNNLRLVDLFPSGKLPKFSIREYTYQSTSKGTESSWPFPLPPFESAEAIRNPSRGAIATAKEADLMGSKVCPVCMTFSSSSNTALNAHMDQCLSGDGELSPHSLPSRHSSPSPIRSKKMKSVADLYKTADGAVAIKQKKHVNEGDVSSGQTSSPAAADKARSRARKEERKRLNMLVQQSQNKFGPRRALSKLDSGESSARVISSRGRRSALTTGETSRKKRTDQPSPDQIDKSMMSSTPADSARIQINSGEPVTMMSLRSSGSGKKRSEKPSPELPLIRKRLRRSSMPSQEDSSAAKRKSSAGPDDDDDEDDESTDTEIWGDEQKEADIEDEQSDQEISIPADSQVPVDEQKEIETGDPINLNLNVIPAVTAEGQVAETSKRPILDLNESVQVLDAAMKESLTINVADVATHGKGQKSPSIPMIRLMGKDLVVVNNHASHSSQTAQSPPLVLPHYRSQIAEPAIAPPEIIVIDDDDDDVAENQPSAQPPPDASSGYNPSPNAGNLNLDLNLNPPPDSG